MAIKATLRQQSGIKASLNNKKEVVAQTIKVSSGNIGLGDLNNVNLTGATDGSVLIFDGSTNGFKVVNNVENENLIVTGGLY